LSILLYSADLWPLSVTQMKKLEATRHKFQRRLLGISQKDKVNKKLSYCWETCDAKACQGLMKWTWKWQS